MTGPETGPETGPGTEPPDAQPGTPLLRVVRGDPSAAELAALVSVVAALGTAAGSEPSPPRSEWSSPHRRLRGPVQSTGAGGWRASGLPR